MSLETLREKAARRRRYNIWISCALGLLIVFLLSLCAARSPLQ